MTTTAAKEMKLKRLPAMTSAQCKCRTQDWYYQELFTESFSWFTLTTSVKLVSNSNHWFHSSANAWPGLVVPSASVARAVLEAGVVLGTGHEDDRNRPRKFLQSISLYFSKNQKQTTCEPICIHKRQLPVTVWGRHGVQRLKALPNMSGGYVWSRSWMMQTSR